MRDKHLLDKVCDIVSNIFSDNGIELVDITYKKKGNAMVLSVLADTENGITIDECAKMNELIGEALDEEDTIGENYVLEVSSPGLDRPLKKKGDFLRIKGKRIRVYTYAPVDDKKEFAGALETVDDTSIEVFDDNSKLTRIPFDKISKATLDYKSLI